MQPHAGGQARWCCAEGSPRDEEGAKGLRVLNSQAIFGISGLMVFALGHFEGLQSQGGLGRRSAVFSGMGVGLGIALLKDVSGC